MKTFEINSIQDLIKLAEMDILTPEQFLDVMQKCEPFVGIFLEKYSKTSEIAVIMRERIKHGGECMPIFWDMDIIAKRT